MLKQYDKAVLERLTGWFGKTVRVVQSRQSLLTAVLEEGDDNMRYPLLAVRRMSLPRILNTSRQYSSADGYAVAGNDTTGEMSVLRSIPCEIPYNILLLDRTREGIDRKWEQIVWLMINNPQLTVEIPYAEYYEADPTTGEMTVKHNRTTYANMLLNNDGEDMSASEEHLGGGQVYAYEFGFTIPDAFLFSTKDKQGSQIIGGDIEIGDIVGGDANGESIIDNIEECKDKSGESEVLEDSKPSKVSGNRASETGSAVS
jgi:hypothetical protein